MAEPIALTRSQFAAHIGRRPSYVTRLGQSGRLVLTPDGSRVLVEPTLELIQASRDPSKAPVAARWRRYREANGGRTEPLPPEEADEPPADGIPSYAASRAIKEHWSAKTAQREHELACGLLMEAERVRAVVADAVTTLRQQIEALPITLGPMLAAEPDEARCVAMLREHIGLALSAASEQFKALASGAGR